MKLAQIMTLALRQLDEDPADIAEYEELFLMYANEGCSIAVLEYLKPREALELKSNERGDIPITGMGIERVVEVRHMRGDGRIQRNVPFELDPSGVYIHTPYKDENMLVLCEKRPVPMETLEDEPKMQPAAHAALVDYICYRHLLNGNMAKQQRAQQYLQAFYSAMRRLTPQGFGSVRREINLYPATDIRRW